MRQITTKYDGECKNCGEILTIGTPVMYEKSMGIFCIGHEPKEVEEIRKYRLEKAEKKASRYIRWAKSHEVKSESMLNQAHRMGSVIPFGQPILVGHHSEGRDRRYRGRMQRNFERGFEEKEKADSLRSRASSILNIRVKGDAQRRDEQKRAEVNAWVKVGMMVHCGHFGDSKVLKVNKKTVTIQGKFSQFPYDKIFISQVKES